MQISNQITKRLPRILGLIALLTCVPLTACADAGTPLTHLPDDYIVFQLGDDQICLFDISKRQIALSARGQDPIVVLPKEN
jgi:hypothetical protein